MVKRKNQRKVVPRETVVVKLKERIDDLSKQIPIEAAYLFGSYANGQPKPYSDVDVAIISPNFGRNYINETVFLMDIFEKIGFIVEPHVFTSEEHKEAMEGTFLYDEVIQKGIPLILKNKL